MWQRIYSTGFWVFVALDCLVMFVGALLLFVIVGPFDRRRFVQHMFSCIWAQSIFYANPLWRLKIEGRHRIPWRKPAVIVSNHESLGDILVLFGLYRPFKWVSKASVFKVPLLGWNMRFNRYIPLVRGNRQSIVKMMERCRYWLDQGVPVLFFPEGTRSPDGNTRAFKDGAFRLAVEAGVPVIPIALVGTSEILPKHGLVLRGTPDCRVRVLDPVDSGGFQSAEELRDHVRDLIVAEKSRLNAERSRQESAVLLPGSGDGC